MNKFFTFLIIILLAGIYSFGQTCDTLVYFAGSNASRLATSATSLNLSDSINANTSGSIVGAKICSGDSAFRCSKWDSAKYWIVNMNTVGFTSLQISFTQRSTGTGPRDFRLQYSINGGTSWTNSGGAYIVDTTLCITKNINLAAATEQVANLLLRWVVVSGTSPRGGAISNSGTSSISNILVTGTPSSLTPPTLIPASGATVDNPFTVTFTDNAAWRSAVSRISINCVILPVSAYTVSAGQITFNPSASSLLQSAGTKSIVISAYGYYSNDYVSQLINAGVPASLTVTTQPVGPTASGGILATQPVVKASDQYNNTVTGSFPIAAAVTTGQSGNWSLGGTTTANTSGTGLAAYTNLTATNLTFTAYNGTITFSYGSISVTSAVFIIPGLPPVNDNCSNAIALTIGSPTTGTLVSSTQSIGLSNDSTKKDVWYKFTPTCTASHTVTLNFSSSDLDFEVFTSSCPSSGAAPIYAHTNTASTETRTSNYLGGTTYFVRVIDNGGTSNNSFTITVTVNAPAQPAAITGIINPCENSSQIYSVLNVVGLTYAWTLPAGWTGSLTTNSIAVVAGSSSGNITVTPSNGCGLTGPSQTLAVAPVTTALDVTGAAANAGNGRLSITWTNVDCFDEVMVVATDNSTVTSVPSGDGSAYTASNIFANSSPDNSVGLVVGEYCIYKGTSSSVSLVGLLNTNVYKIKIFTRWGTMWSGGVQITGTPVAASTGAFKSIISGNWTDNTVWEKYNGTSWVPTSGAGDYPNYFGSNVTIEAGTTVKLNTTPVSVHSLTINPGGKLFTGLSDTSQLKYVSVFGDILCDGIVGNTNPSIADNISFNIDSTNCTITGSGKFSCSRIRKLFDKNDPGGSNTTNLFIDMDIVAHWPGTALYNASTPSNTYATFFNVTLNNPYMFTCKDTSGSVAIDGLKGTGFYKAGGKFLVNGTLNVGGALYLSTNNANSNGINDPCTFEIGSTGIVKTRIVSVLNSGIATHTFTIKPKGLLNVTDSSGFAVFIKTNNVINIYTGSTIEFSANGGQEILCGLTYSNLKIDGTGQKIISNANNVLTVNDTLFINSGTLAIGAKTLAVNGFISGNGTITGSSLSKMTIGPSTTQMAAPLGMLKFTPGSERLNVLTMDRYMKRDSYPNYKYWAAALNSKLDVDTLRLNQGILATGHNLLTLLYYPSNAYSTLNTASYVATTDATATAFNIGETFDGSYGFRINGVKANTDTWFPVGADFISPNRVWLNLGNGAAARDLTVAITKGDITHTGSPRVSRIWYINSTVIDSVNARMRLYYNAYDLATYPYLTKQDELETGFTGTQVRLVQKAKLSDNFFINISNDPADIMFNGSPNAEKFASYTTASTLFNGTHAGIYKFNIFSIVDGDNVVLPVTFTNVRAYQQGTGVAINWSVTNEINIDHYEVERAGDGRLFATILSSAAHNGSTAGSSYTANDLQPLPGTNYYRVKAVSKDGQAIYTGVVNVTLGAGGKTSMVVYPNPVKSNYCNVQLNNLTAGTYRIAVYNMAGQLLTSRQIEHIGGSVSQRIYLPAGAASGIYIVKVTGKNINLQTSIFVNHK